MSKNIKERVVIVPGSKADFWADIEDENTGQGIPLNTYTDGKAVFTNCDGERVEVALDTNNDSGICGSVFVSIPGAETAKFDKRSLDFDFEFMDGTELIVFPVDNLLELRERNTPTA